MQKRIWLALCLLAAVLLAGCGGQQEDVSVDRTVERAFGSYTVPGGWVRSEKYSSDDKVFYLLQGHEDDKEPDNVSVKMGENRYAAAEHEQFRTAILSQLANQLAGLDNVALTGYGDFTEAGDVVYVLTITEDLEDGKQVITRQYYIVGEKRYVLVHLTSFSGDEATDEAAELIANSFVWSE